MTQLTPEEFIQIWKGDEDIRSQMPSYYVQEPGSNGTTTTVVHLNNLKIVGNVVLSDIDTPLMTLHLKGISFQKIQFKNCRVGHVIISSHSNFEEIELVGAKTYVEYLKVAECHFKNLSIYNGAKSNIITVESNQGEPNIAVEESGTQLSYLKLLRAKIGLLELAKAASIVEIDVDGSIIRHVKLHENSQVSNLHLSNESICLALELESVSINERLIIEDTTINYVWFQVKTLLEGTIRRATVQKFNYKTLVSTTLNIFDSKLIEFSLQHIRTGKDGLLQLINCQVNTLQFDTVLNLMSINIKDITPLKSTIYYKHSPCDPYELYITANESHVFRLK